MGGHARLSLEREGRDGYGGLRILTEGGRAPRL